MWRLTYRSMYNNNIVLDIWLHNILYTQKRKKEMSSLNTNTNIINKNVHEKNNNYKQPIQHIACTSVGMTQFVNNRERPSITIGEVFHGTLKSQTSDFIVSEIDKDGKINNYEEARGKAIEKSMAQQDKGKSMKDEKSKFMGGGIAYAGGGRAMKRKGGKV